MWAGEVVPLFVDWAVTGLVHLRERAHGDWYCGEGGSHDGNQARAEVIRGFVNMEAGHLDGGEEAGDNQGG
ncbi:predicted protein [Histoplasma mississippiense (nom. inval.)]|uniref:predicted protein n=1 Tax=Ajellomyces capsulatus (strain NAm1 / WU24) TaxID=2059318 RepID=UPI000157B606|nr:predicted protein [Histoplasma mississippiense (nom. inval.)]EDN02890.1 predicted protein [Histoplasma mississippiense (nom. inval.)]